MAREARGIPAERAESGFARWAWIIAVFAVAATPLFISWNGKDSFRLPKELLFEACGIVSMSLALLGVVWNRITLRPREIANSPVVMVVIIVGWTVIASVLSTKPRLSVYTLVWVLCSAALFLALYAGARRASMAILLLGIIPALVNALLAISQAFIWNPFMGEEQRTTLMNMTIGLLGNSNDLGTFLLPSLVCTIAASAVWRKWRGLLILAGIILAVGIILSRSISSILASGICLIAFAFLLTRRWRILILTTLAVAGTALILLPSPIQQRIRAARQLVRSGQYDTAVSARLRGSVAAWEMFLDHPIAGVGPGAYSYHFFAYVIAVQREFPGLLRSDIELTNFHEAHNDHLQILATAGLPGYVLLIAAIVCLGRRSFVRPSPADEKARFARLASFPLATVFCVSALAQFPLEIAAALSAYLFYAALCLAWLPSPQRQSLV